MNLHPERFKPGIRQSALDTDDVIDHRTPDFLMIEATDSSMRRAGGLKSE